MTAPHRQRLHHAFAWRLACFRLATGALAVDLALLPGLGSILW